MLNVAVFFGGRSCEHDVSVITGVQTMANLCAVKYKTTPIYMKDGAFYTGERLKDVSFFEKPNMKKCTKLWLIDGAFYSRVKNVFVKKFTPDVALVCCHGGEGENGVLQGLLEYNGIPYTSAGVLQSSLCMDKVLSKQLVDGLMLNTVPEISFLRADYLKNTKDVLRHVTTFLDYPMIVKPASLGSSIGIRRADNQQELKDAIEIAMKFDRKIIVESALSDFTELNCAVFSDGKDVFVSEVERPVGWNDFLSFDDKYLSGNKTSENKREFPAKISEEIRDEVRETSKRIYTDLDMSGVIRIDYLLSSENKLFVNEINTVPGSMAFYLFEPSGITFSDLLDRITEGALRAFSEKKKSRLQYDSSVIKNFASGGGSKRLQK